MGRFLKVFVLILFFLLSMLFFVQNHQILSTPLELVFNYQFKTFKTPPLPFYVVLLVFFTLGGLFSLVYFFFEKLKTNGLIRSLTRKNESLEAEVRELRSIPLNEAPTRALAAPEEPAKELAEVAAPVEIIAEAAPVKEPKVEEPAVADAKPEAEKAPVDEKPKA